LYKKDKKEAIHAGSKQLMQAARDLVRSDVARASAPRPDVLMITG
jgi:hypothetical protein